MQGLSIEVKDLKEGMRVVEYGYGNRIISTVLEDAHRVSEDRDEEGSYDGWEARARPDNPTWQEICYFECVEGSAYGMRLVWRSAGHRARRRPWRGRMPDTREDCFSVDVPLTEEWLINALESRRQGRPVRVTVVIKDAGLRAQYGAKALGGGDEGYFVCALAGDFTQSPVWRGEAE